MSRKPQILVVEDEGVVALDICQMLEDFDYQVVSQVDNGKEALAKATTLRPDLILMDIHLKGEMDGIETAALISDSTKTPIVFLTAHADEATLQRAKLARPFGFILKPFEADELRTTLEIVLHRAQLETPSTKHVEGEEVEVASLPVLDADTLAGRLELLHGLSLFSAMKAEELSSLAEASSISSFDAGQIIAEGEQEPDFGFVLLSGRLAVTKGTEAGKELTLELLPPGDVIGIFRAVDGVPPGTTVQAQTPAKLLCIPRATLRVFVEKHPLIYKKIAQEMAQRLKHSQELAVGLAHTRVDSRIISTLLALVPRFGKLGIDKQQPRINITRKELADLTGTTPETAIRVTKALEREGVLDLTKPGIIKILGLDQLKSMLN